MKMYKVVMRKDGPVILCDSWRGSRLSVEYRPNEWEKARVGGLFVFDDLENARAFMGSEEGLEIWECEVFGKIRLPRVGIVPHADDLRLEEAAALSWAGNTPLDRTLVPWPTGTRAYRRVKLVKRVGGNHV